MNSPEAKKILELYCTESAEADDGRIASALEQTEHDPELRQWFEQSDAFHMAMRRKFREIAVPSDLREKILAGNKIVRLAWWQKPVWLAAAAAIVLGLGLSIFWLPSRATAHFSAYRSRMVRTALRQYRMDIVTNDLKEIRQFLAQRGAPSDYVLTKELEKLPVTGAGCLRWQNHPVSMVCFDRGDKQMLFLFVVGRSALKDTTPNMPKLAKVNKLLTESWIDGDKAYLLAGPEDSALFHQ